MDQKFFCFAETDKLQLLVNDVYAARLLSIGRSTLWREVNAGRLPKPIKIGGVTRWRVSDLHRYVDNQDTSIQSEPTLVAISLGTESPRVL
ncbi:MAG: helix-turn-helix domain-containing protein [Betaproteobacteria bacterium]|nr:helix-turn-helix domain-containing protein [Betaproteobacteria bacterium]